MKTSRFISLLLCVVMIMSLFTGLAGSASADDVIVHEVQSGEIMLKICEKHGLNYYASKNAIMQLNGFTSEAQLAKLSVGQKIKLPASDAVASTVSTSTAVVTTTTAGGTTTTTTSYVGTTAAGGNIAYYLTAYTVQAGDTLASICNKLGSNYYYYSPVILGINSLTNANYIRPGQVLLIPTPTAGGAGYAVVAHRVQAGETTTSICNRYGISYQAMRQLINGLNRRDNMDKIYPGQTVYVPTSAASAAATTVVSTGTTTTTTGTAGTSTAAASAGYTISFASGGAFASVNGKDYVTSAPAGSEVSIWSKGMAGYAVKSLEVVRMDTGAPVPVDYNYFTMPNANVYVDVTYEKGLTITKAKTQGGSFETTVGGFLTNAAFAGDLVTILAYPNQYYSVASVSYQKTDYTVTAVDVKKDASGNYAFTMPDYPITVTVKFAPTQYHNLSYSGIIGNGKVTFTVGNTQVTQAEQGEAVTLKFTPDKNWAFNTSDFENNLAAHITNKSSLGSFKKIDDTTYTFIMGTQDINVVGVQFINRSSYTITGTVWKDMKNATNGSMHFNVIDQATGAITYNTKMAKFGDTVQVIYKPAKNYVNDAQYTRDNSKGAGNALLAWDSDNTFTMPDSNVTVNARFVQDGAAHTYSQINKTLVPAAGGTVEFISEGCVTETAEVGKVVTVKVTPKPNYCISVAKYLPGTPVIPIYAVSLNGKIVGEAAAESSFTQVDENTYTFVKRSGTDTIRVAFASEYQGVNATFTQVTEGGAMVVQGIKGFAINGNYVSGDAQVVYGDTVSFNVDLLDGYEITSVRKYACDNSDPANPKEIPNTTTYIPGGKDNSYSYTVTRDDVTVISSAIANGEITSGVLVFEITARENPQISYTIKYTVPKIDGKTPYIEGTTDPACYYLAGKQISTDTLFRAAESSDILGISGNLVDASDILIGVLIPKDNICVDNPATLETMYYTFDKLLLNGAEFSEIDSSSDPANYIATFYVPKDAPDGIVTTEVVYKYIKTVATEAITLDKLTIDGNTFTTTPGVFTYSLNIGGSTLPQVLSATYSATPDSVEFWVNDTLLDPTNPEANWVKGPNTLVIKIHKSDKTDTTYTFTINYGLEASALTDLTIDGTPVTPSVTDPAHPVELTIYEATVKTLSSSVALTAADFKEATWVLNGESIFVNNTTSTQTINWAPGLNTLEISVTENDKAPTTYVISVNCALPGASKLETVEIDNAVNLIPTGTITMVEDKFDYEALVSGGETSMITITAPSNATITAYINGNTHSSMQVSSATTLNFDTSTLGSEWLYWQNGVNTLMIKVQEDDKTESTYNIKVTCNKDASELTALSVDGTPVLSATKTNYNITVSKDTSTIDLDSVSGNHTITYSINGEPEMTTTGTSFNITWPKDKDNKLIIKVHEDGKTETVYTLTVKKMFPASPVEEYVTIDGDTVKFNNSLSASYTTLGLTSEVIVTLNPGLTVESLKLEINGVIVGDASTATTGTDAEGRPTYTFSGVNWKPGANTMKIYVKYQDQTETVHSVSVHSHADNLALDEVLITGDPTGRNYKNGGSGVKLYGSTDEVKATAHDPAANVTINVYGDVGSSPFTATAAGTATVSGITWNTDGNESNRIDVIVENGGYTKTYSITGAYMGATP